MYDDDECCARGQIRVLSATADRQRLGLGSKVSRGGFPLYSSAGNGH